MARKTRKMLLGVLFSGVIMLVALYVFVGMSPPFPPLPNPNGHDDFLRPGKMVTGKVDDFTDLDREALRAWVEKMRKPLRVLRLERRVTAFWVANSRKNDIVNAETKALGQ